MTRTADDRDTPGADDMPRGDDVSTDDGTTANGTAAVDTTATGASGIDEADADRDPGADDRRQHVSADVAPELFG
ncbi:hypothetical protein [Salinigranum sp. GCM10025319]|uniref:hypothetical protein n=1 Tax=Salinigranum sp. GCM10025319 TaxID=3252687 RepID=UPI003605F641